MAKTEIEQIKLYSGDVAIDYYPNSHQYKIDGKNIPSVTSITGIIDKSSALLLWAERLTNEYVTDDKLDGEPYSNEALQSIVKEAAHQYTVVKKEAASIGDLVHDYAAAFAQAKIEGKPLPKIDVTDQQAINGINAFIEWYKAHKVEFLRSEFIVYSKKYNYVGRCDALAWIDDELTVVDFKTGARIYPEAHLQLAAYTYAYDEEDQKLVKKRLSGRALILHFSKDSGGFTIHPVKNLKRVFQGFKAALKLKELLKELK